MSSSHVGCRSMASPSSPTCCPLPREIGCGEESLDFVVGKFLTTQARTLPCHRRFSVQSLSSRCIWFCFAAQLLTKTTRKPRSMFGAASLDPITHMWVGLWHIGCVALGQRGNIGSHARVLKHLVEWQLAAAVSYARQIGAPSPMTALDGRANARGVTCRFYTKEAVAWRVPRIDNKLHFSLSVAAEFAFRGWFFCHWSFVICGNPISG
jgi:hypothetical protein